MLSSTGKIFEEEVRPYQEALKQSGYKTKLQYTPREPAKKRVRRRNILWFNPPFSIGVQTGVAEKFLKLLDHHFPVGSKLHKFFNRNTVKVSYSTTKNMKAHIDQHNKTIINPKLDEGKGCNCRKPENCPLNGECLQKSVIYQADVQVVGGKKMSYIGLTERTFKERYREHTGSFRHENQGHKTELSKYIWKLKNENKQFEIAWSIKSKAYAYQSGMKRCDLCLQEKTYIALADPKKTLNSRTEILAKCRHKRKFTLQCCKRIHPP